MKTALPPHDISDARRANMRAIRAKHTKPELIVRRLLHRHGYRFRLHAASLPGKPDIVFPARRKAVEIRGCFWHRHPDPSCRNAVLPRTRREWWEAKLTANAVRDARNVTALESLGWAVLVLWECEVASPDLLHRLTGFLGPPAHRNAAAAGIPLPEAARDGEG